MARSFEEIDVWKKARELVNFIYRFTKNKEFSKDFSLTDQIRRAAVSVMSNIAEGFERGSNTEFIQFLYIAKGSENQGEFDSALRKESRASRGLVIPDVPRLTALLNATTGRSKKSSLTTTWISSMTSHCFTRISQNICSSTTQREFTSLLGR